MLKQGATKGSTTSRGDSAKVIGRNTIFGIGASVTQMATRLVTVPIVISHLGLDGYGIWSIIMTTVAYMRLGNVGIKAAFQKYVAEATGTGDYEYANRLLSTGTVVVTILSTIGLVPVAFFSRKLASATGVPPQFLDSTAVAISLLAVFMVLVNGAAAFEGIVMGAHRIDLTRKLGTVFSVLEAVAIVALLHFGYGLVAMSAVMATSEVAYLVCCFIASRRVLPEVSLGLKYFTPGVFRELIRFAGSYQLVNLLDVLYMAILPVAVLKFFGASEAGVFAVANRLVSAASLPQEAFLVPLLSGGSLAYGSGSSERIRQFLGKAFRVTLILAVLPLAFVASHGTTFILAWTGQSSPLFQSALWLLSIAALFKSVSVLQFVLYRASGRTVMDNIRQFVRIALLMTVGSMAGRLGFNGILAGLAFTEFVGMIFMFFGMNNAFHGFDPRTLVPDLLRLVAATLPILIAGALVASLPFPMVSSERLAAAIKIVAISAVTMAVAWPALALTGSLSDKERGVILDIFRKISHASA